MEIGRSGAEVADDEDRPLYPCAAESRKEERVQEETEPGKKLVGDEDGVKNRQEPESYPSDSETRIPRMKVKSPEIPKKAAERGSHAVK